MLSESFIFKVDQMKDSGSVIHELGLLSFRAELCVQFPKGLAD